jgi:hypothetical protein
LKGKSNVAKKGEEQKEKVKALVMKVSPKGAALKGKAKFAMKVAKTVLKKKGEEQKDRLTQ